MAIIIPNGLTAQEIRVLQEFRRRTTDSLTRELIEGVRHPAGGGLEPAEALAGKGYLEAEGDGFKLTEKGKTFLAYDPVP